MLLMVLATGESLAQSWFELGTGSSALKAMSEIYALCSDDSNNIYAAGKFKDTSTGLPGDIYVARWSVLRRHWEKLGIGSSALNPNGPIRTMCADKHNNIYVSGNLNDTTGGFGYIYVAKWNGSSWSKLGTGANALARNGGISSIAVDDTGNVYAAGTIRNGSFFYVAMWHAAAGNWSDLGLLNANLNINSICLDDSNNVYAAGNFTDGAGHTYIAKYRAATHSWGELGTGFFAAGNEVVVASIKLDSFNHVYAGVNFRPVSSSTTTSNVFKWDGVSWSQLGSLNGNSSVEVIAVERGGTVYAGGFFSNAYGLPYVSQFDTGTNSWNEVGGVNALNAHSYFSALYIAALYIDKYGYLYASGSFMDSNNTCYVASYGKPYLEIETVENDGIQVRVYPNPANSILYFEIPSASESNIRIMDITGRVVAQQPVHGELSAGVDVKGFTPGMYIYQVSTGKKVWTGKILVQ